MDAPPPEGPRQTGSQPIAIGQIDDDRHAERPDNVFVTLLLLPVKAIGAVIEIPVQQIKTLQGETAGKAARMTVDSESADTRREGVYRLVDYSFARRAPYTTHYEQMARGDPDPTVRVAALRACNRARDPQATSTFIAVLSDAKEPDTVRLEAAKGLCNLPDPAAIAPLLGVVNTPEANRDLRIASVDALKYYRSLEVGRALGNVLVDRDFAVAWQARRSLVYLTHKDFNMDQGAWLGYIAGPEKPLE